MERKPHVLSPEQAQRNLDLVVFTPKQAGQFLTPDKFLGSGAKMMCFIQGFEITRNRITGKETKTDNVVVLPYINQLGEALMRRIVKTILEQRTDLAQKDENTLTWSLHKDGPIEYYERSILNRITNHNSAFRRGPIVMGDRTITVYPINTLLVDKKENPVGFIMKRTEGDTAQEGDEHGDIAELQENLGGAGENQNIIIIQSSNTDNKPFEIVLLDLEYDFVPSNLPLDMFPYS